jgi:hypothetical protein
MFFIIRDTPAYDSPRDDAQLHHFYRWTLHRKDRDAEDMLGEAICQSVDSWPTERQCRAAINTAKKSMQGVRFAQTRVASP